MRAVVTLEKLARIRLIDMGDMGRSAFAYQVAAVFAAFGAQVEDPVGIADHVEIVLDDDDGVAEVGEAVQDFEELAHVVEVEAGGGLVEQIESTTGLAFAEFAGELHALGFAA